MDKLAFLFPGQGSQYANMGGHLYQNHAPTRALFAEADAALGYKISEIILQGPDERLKETEVTQPALLTVSVATARYLLEHGLSPEVMAGHSLGEYSALVVAGSIDFSDAVKLVRLRGRYMQQAVPAGVGTMAAILGLEDSQVEQLCTLTSQNGALVEPAGYNCPGQVVIAGHVAAVEKVMELAKKQGAKSIPLKVSAPFHCSLLRSAADQLAVELNKITIKPPRIPYLANVDAGLQMGETQIRQKLTDQVCSPVRWTTTLRNMLMMRVQRFVEVGPGKVCVGHLKKVERRKGERAATFAVTDKESDLQGVLELFGKSNSA